MNRERTRTRRGFTVVELLVVVGIIVILIALVLPAVLTSRGPRRQIECMYNLRMISLGLANYELQYKTLPPAYTLDAQGKPLHSWRTLILPYMDQTVLYNQIDLARPWNDPVNATAAATRVNEFLCPSAVADGAKTNYLAIVGESGFLAPGRPRRLDEITDGLATTVSVVEVGRNHAVPWMAPFDTNTKGLATIVTRIKPHHEEGSNAALGDGSVRFLKTHTPVAKLRALATISGNDNDAINAW